MTVDFELLCKIQAFDWLLGSNHEPLKLPGWKACSKKFKTPFFLDIPNFFHGVADIGLEPHQKFFFENISTNMVARGIRSFGILEGTTGTLIE